MKVLIVDDMHPHLMERLIQEGVKVDYRPEISKPEIENCIGEYDGLVVRSKVFVDEKLLGANPKIKFVARAGAGTDNLDHRFLEEHRIQIINAPEGNRAAVGDHTLGLILSLTNHLNKGHKEIQAGIWDREGNRGLELGNMTVGIVGFGNTGSEVAKRLKGFGCAILAYDKYRKNLIFEGVEFCEMSQIFENADLVTFHIPLTYETNHLINDNFICEFSKSIYLINASRGKIAKNSALIDGLKSGKIKGLGLDVLENEKISTLNIQEKAELDYLANHPNVILSPHVAGWTVESYQKISEVISNKIIDAFCSKQ